MGYKSIDIDNAPPENYPIVGYNEGLHDNLIVRNGIYVVNRNGQVVVTTTGNDRWDKDDALNRGFFRAKYIGNRDDYLEYANQCRLATRKEIEKTIAWVKNEKSPYRRTSSGQMAFF